ncbi:MAG TPA: HAD hydrolase-like protein, partial [Stenomitos sp.]
MTRTMGAHPMSYKLLIFDFDGTIADSFPWFVGIVNQVAEKYRFRRIDESEIESLRSFDARQLIQHLGIPFWKLPFIARHMKRQMAREIHQIALFEGIPALLRQLSERGVQLAMVSSNSVENIRRVLGPEIAGLFRYYECGG